MRKRDKTIPSESGPAPGGPRIIRVTGPIEDESANVIVAHLLYWNMDSPKEVVWLDIDSPGGAVIPVFAILDTMRFVGNPIHTYCGSEAAGIALLLFANGVPGRRIATVGAQFTFAEITISEKHTTDHDRFFEKVQRRVVDEFCLGTNMSRAEVSQLLDGRPTLSANEAVVIGLADSITADRLEKLVSYV